MPELILMNTGMHVMAPEPISTPYFINPSHQCVCVFMCIPLIVARQRLDKRVPAERTHGTVGELLNASCSMLAVSCRESIGLCMPLWLLGNSSVNTFPQGIIIGGVVFYSVRFVSKEGRRLVIPKTSGCF
jgi:hypothetical protein